MHETRNMDHETAYHWSNCTASSSCLQVLFFNRKAPDPGGDVFDERAEGFSLDGGDSDGFDIVIESDLAGKFFDGFG